MKLRPIDKKEAIKLTEHIITHEHRWIRNDEWPSDVSSRHWPRVQTYWPLFIVDERYVCALDVFFGHDLVVDIKDQEVFLTTKGIFTKDWCFMSDYYGYPEGAFFYRVKEDK